LRVGVRVADNHGVARPDLTVEDHVGIAAQDLERIRRFVAAQHTLEEVLRGLHALTPSRTVSHVVTQDEYTHDVIARYDERLFLVYDTS
jgi:hypothetical protein